MMSWYVVYTHVHSETKALTNLERQGFETYLPLARRWRNHAGRRETVLRPLFSRYLFVQFDVEHDRWRSVLATMGVANLLCEREKPRRVADEIVSSISAAEQARAFDDTRAVAKLSAGDRVRVACGPFADLVGQLQVSMAGDRVRILLDMLGRRVPAVVPLADVVPA
jgi:transcriptional antiterminator RfaH